MTSSPIIVIKHQNVNSPLIYKGDWDFWKIIEGGGSGGGKDFLVEMEG